AAEQLRRELQFCDIDRPEWREGVKLETLWGMLVVEPTLIGQEQFPDRPLSLENLLHLGVVCFALQGTRTDERTGHHVDLKREAAGMTELVWNVRRHYRSQLDHRIATSTGAPSPHYHTATAQPQVGSVEEDHLSELSVQHLHVEGHYRRPVVAILDRQLQLNAIDALEQGERLYDPLVGLACQL